MRSNRALRRPFMKTQQDKWDVDKDVYSERPCIECNATGEIEKQPCPFCEGQGSLPVVRESCE